jgi:regulator of protease activity HflC (stomatin/prohibitin superfamily)
MRPPVFDNAIVPVLALALLVTLIWWIVRVARSTFTSTTVLEHEAGLRYRDGKLDDILGPGRYPSWRRGVTIETLDLREQTIHVAGQETLTRDNLSVRASLTASVRVNDPRRRVTTASDPTQLLYEALQVALRKAIGARTLEQFLDVRSAINGEVIAEVAPRAKALGYELIAVSLLDVMLTGETKRAYADIFRARKDGEAALERARGETAALRNLANGARMLKDNPQLFNLRLLQTLTTSAAKGATVVLNASGETVIGAGPAPEPDAERPTE